MKKIAPFLIIALLFESCSFNCVKGEGESVNKTLNMDLIKKIEVEGSIDVLLRFDLNQRVTVTGQENIISLLDTKVSGGTWEIGFSENVCYDDDFYVEIALPTIEGIEIHGSGNVKTVTPFHAKDFDLDVAGSGNAILDINCEDLKVDIRGSGNADLSGRSKSTEINIGGSGNVNAEDLISEEVEANIRGSGDIKVQAKEIVDIGINGSGNVYYYGDPEKVNSSINGSGEAIKK